MQTLWQVLVVTPAVKVAVNPLVEQPTTTLPYVIKSTNTYV
jgi:hypothetical protein